MSIKSDRWITLNSVYENNLIEPFYDRLDRMHDGRKIISRGLSSYGYDCQLALDGFRLFSPVNGTEIDPKNFDERIVLDSPVYKDDKGLYYLIPPHHYGLGMTVEKFNIPRNVTAIAMGKSTYARCGLIINTTPLEAGWKGRLVIEFFNAANLPLRVYVNEGFIQVLFFKSDEECQTSYSDREGKYQDQQSLTLAKV